jgi:hypothetical protein
MVQSRDDWMSGLAATMPAMANTIKESKGVNSQKDILTSVKCPVCGNFMRQNEISVEIAFRHARKPGEPKRERIVKHARNCGKAA